MKVIQRVIIKVVPGKMTEALELDKKHTAVAMRLGVPPMKKYRCLSGRNDVMHTLIVETEWDSLAAMEAVEEKLSADPEIQAFMVKWETVLESQEIELYTPLS